MEEETNSNASSSSITAKTNYVKPNHLSRVGDDLAECLLSLEEFKEKRSLIPYYSQYEFPEQKQKMNEFWNKTIERVMEKYFKSCIVSTEELQGIFNLNGFQPLGLSKVIQELAEDSGYAQAGDKLKLMKQLDMDLQLETKNQQLQKNSENNALGNMNSTNNNSNASFLSKLNPFNYIKAWRNNKDTNSFSNPSTANLPNLTVSSSFSSSDDIDFIVNKKLLQKSYQRFLSCLNSNVNWIRGHLCNEKDLFNKLNENDGVVSIGEVKLFMELLEREGTIRTYQQAVTGNKVVYYDRERIDKVDPAHFANMQVLYDIDLNMQLLENDIAKYALQQELIKKKFSAATDPNKKMQLAKENKLLSTLSEQLHNKKSTLLKNQLQVEEAINNKRVMTVLSQGITAARQNQVDVSAFEEIKENFEEADAREKEIADAFAAVNAMGQENDQEIEQQLKEIERECGIFESNDKQQQYGQVKYNNMVNIVPKNGNQNQMEVEVDKQTLQKAYQDYEDPDLKLLQDLA